jgi:MIP family channel proteins
VAPGRAKYVAEFVGTFVLVLFAAGAVVATARFNGAPIALVCGISSGVILAAVIWGLTPISGGHVNPALTIALAYLGRFPWRLVAPYVLAQLAGSALAGLALFWLLGDFGAMGANLPNAALGISASEAFGLEAMLSFVMMAVILLCGRSDHPAIDTGAIRIGAIVGLEVMLFGPIAGAAMNPARAFGPYLVMGNWSDFWVYAAGPLVGISAAAVLYRRTERLVIRHLQVSCD